MKKLRIIIADDHGMVRQGIKALLEARKEWLVCGEATTGRQAIALASQVKPDIAILDITMPELNGLDTTRQLQAKSPRTRVLILTMHESETLASEVLEAGARGYLLKNDAPELLPRAIEALEAGRVFFTSTVSDLLVSGFTGTRPSRSRLTPREREIVQLLAEGKTNKETSERLGISLTTVETHRKHIQTKLKIRSLADLVRYAIRNQLIQP